MPDNEVISAIRKQDGRKHNLVKMQPVVCINTNKTWRSISECARFFGVSAAKITISFYRKGYFEIEAFDSKFKVVKAGDNLANNNG